MGDRYLDLEPPRASLGQLQLTNKLEMIPVEDDVLGVVSTLRRIDPGLKMFFDFGQEVYVLYWTGLNEQGQVVEDIVGAYKELDPRIVKLMERIDRNGRGRQDLATELDKLEAERQRENDRRRLETVGPVADRLRFAMRNDLGLNGTEVHMSGSREKHRQSKRRK